MLIQMAEAFTTGHSNFHGDLINKTPYHYVLEKNFIIHFSYFSAVKGATNISTRNLLARRLTSIGGFLVTSNTA